MPRWVYAVVGIVALLVIGVATRIVVDHQRGIAGGSASPRASAVSSPATDPGVGDTSNGGQGQEVDGIRCESHEQVAYHVHAHLYILLDGRPQKVSQYIGIPFDATGAPRCFYWLHTHDTSGVIHVESPDQRTFTLGQFFAVWGMPLSRTGVSTLEVPAGDLNVYVDGQIYPDDPAGIELRNHTQVVIELGKQGPPPPYDFGNL